MTRARLSFLAAVLAFGSCRTCVDPGIPRNYQCSADAGPGVDECPDEYDTQGNRVSAWECNPTWGFCFDTARGEPNPCRADAECGGGWRCTPDGRCADPATEGAVSTVEVDESVSLHPRVFAAEPRVFESSEAVRYADPQDSVLTVSTSVLGIGDAGIEWLTVDSRKTPEGELYQTSVAQGPVSGLVSDLAVTTYRAPLRALHYAWGVVDAGVFLLDRDDLARLRPVMGTQSAVSVAPLRLSGDGLGVASGAVGVRMAGRFGIRTPTGRLTLDFPFSDVGEAAWYGGADCGADGALLLARATGLEVYRVDAPGTRVVDLPLSLRPSDLRLLDVGPRTWLGWRGVGTGSPDAGQLSLIEVTGVCGLADAGAPRLPERLRREPCPEGAFAGYDLVDTGGAAPEFVTECLAVDTHLLFLGERRTPIAYLPPRLATREGSWVFSRFQAGQLTVGPGLLDQEPLSLSRPPDVLLPAATGDLVAFTPNAVFFLEDWGFMLEEKPAWQDLPAALVPQRGWALTRTGLVVDIGQSGEVLALPAEDWKNPSSPVLAEVLPQPDGTEVLVAAHDDAFDVAEVGGDVATLATRLKPSPATPILSMALQPSRDGGTAEGYVVAGLELFQVFAPSPRRWSAARVPLAGLRPVFVWFDRGRPRALLDDGTVLGLVTRVPLSRGLEDEVRAGAALCGAPFALTDDALYRLAPAAPGASRPYEWDFVQLPGAEVDRGDGTFDVTDFSRGRLMVLGDALYVFSSAGAAWKLTPEGGACPAP